MLVRKISRAKWQTFAHEDGKPVTADAVTGDLRTQHNNLSLWQISDLSKLHEAALAIVSAQECLDAIDLAALDEKELIEKGFSVQETLGSTPVKELQQIHRDIVSLTCNDLRPLAQVVISSFRQKRVKRISKKEILDIVTEAI
ncbi:unnamed protein product, partial [marine sediment metagenome]